MEEERKSGEWQRQSGQYQQPAPAGGLSNSLKAWFALVPILSLALSFGGSYAGKAYKEGETQNEIQTLKSEINRLREAQDKISERYITQKYFDDRMKDLKEASDQSEDRLMERLDDIRGDVRKKYSQR